MTGGSGALGSDYGLPRAVCSHQFVMIIMALGLPIFTVEAFATNYAQTDSSHP